VGSDYTEQQLRAVMRQLIAIGALHVHTNEGFSTLHLTEGSRGVLRGEVLVQLRESTSQRPDKRSKSRSSPGPAAANLSQDALVRFINLKAWRAEVAKEHNLPAYVIFHDATLAAIAERAPQAMSDLEGISGLGVKKLEAYGAQVVQVCDAT
jgi:ATP-dependent DNA helicase RecQ